MQWRIDRCVTGPSASAGKENALQNWPVGRLSFSGASPPGSLKSKAEALSKPGLAKGSGISKAPATTARKALGQRSASSANQILPKGLQQQVVSGKNGVPPAKKDATKSSVNARPPAMLSRASTQQSIQAPSLYEMPKMSIFGSVPSQVVAPQPKHSPVMALSRGAPLSC